MGYHDLSPEAFLTVEVQQTNTAEDAYLFRQWLDTQAEKVNRLISLQKQGGSQVGIDARLCDECSTE